MGGRWAFGPHQSQGDTQLPQEEKDAPNLTRKERRRDVSNFLLKNIKFFIILIILIIFFIILIILFLQLGFLPIEAPPAPFISFHHTQTSS